MLPHSGAKKSPQSESRGERSGGRKNKKGFDDHSKWGGGEENNRLEAVWKVRIKNAAEVVAIREKSLNRGLIPLAAQRLIKEFGKSQLDWRAILNNFVQEEVCDYSFAPPDRRYDGDFFLPDFDRVRVNDADVALDDMRTARRDNQPDDVFYKFFIAVFWSGHFVKNPLISCFGF